MVRWLYSECIKLKLSKKFLQVTYRKVFNFICSLFCQISKLPFAIMSEHNMFTENYPIRVKLFVMQCRMGQMSISCLWLLTGGSSWRWRALLSHRSCLCCCALATPSTLTVVKNYFTYSSKNFVLE